MHAYLYVFMHISMHVHAWKIYFWGENVHLGDHFGHFKAFFFLQLPALCAGKIFPGPAGGKREYIGGEDIGGGGVNSITLILVHLKGMFF